MSNQKNDSSSNQTVTARRRELATLYHTGQFSELYKVSSSGSYDSVSGLRREIRDACSTASILEFTEEKASQELTEFNQWYRELGELL